MRQLTLILLLGAATFAKTNAQSISKAERSGKKTDCNR